MKTISAKCPACLHEKSGLPTTLSPNALLTCANCERKFSFGDALGIASSGVLTSPARPMSLDPSQARSNTVSSSGFTALADTSGRMNSLYFIVLPMLLIVMFVINDRVISWPGPSFLVLLGMLCVAFKVAEAIIRNSYVDSNGVSAVFSIAIGVFALIRHMMGSAQGMENFWGMWVITIIAVVVFFARADGHSSSSDSISSCSGCGGGGGCGGCGGCG